MMSSVMSGMLLPNRSELIQMGVVTNINIIEEEETKHIYDLSDFSSDESSKFNDKPVCRTLSSENPLLTFIHSGPEIPPEIRQAIN
jgi:hypothetical protein